MSRTLLLSRLPFIYNSTDRAGVEISANNSDVRRFSENSFKILAVTL